MSTAAPICPCGTVEHPRAVSNLPALPSVQYRTGDFRSFRHALLLPLDGEAQLLGWRPSGTGDLTMQLVEWWAYVADVLTFYSERIANGSFLRTSAPDELRRIVQLLGYRPRPGVGATGTLAALLRSGKPLTIPEGLQVQSKPGPGTSPQTFEVSAETAVGAPDAVDLDPISNGALFRRESGQDSILLAGSVSAVEAGDRVLVVARAFTGAAGEWALATIASVAQEKDPRGTVGTRLTFTSTLAGIATSALAAAYRVLVSTQTARPYGYSNATALALQTGQVDLDAVARSIVPGDVVLLEDSGSSPLAPVAVKVTSNQEVIWYANAADGTPETPPADPTAPIVVVHSRLGLTPALSSSWTSKRLTAVIRHTWIDVGRPIGEIPRSVSTASSPLVVSAATVPSELSLGADVIVEDAAGAGVTAVASPGAAPLTISLASLPEPGTTLVAPLRALLARVPVSRGETVTGEVLGSGDQAVPGQEFKLKKSPLTYLPAGSVTGSPGTNLTGLASTLRVYVDGLEWTEVPTFYGQARDSRVFVTREDEAEKTHVMFGDGVYGARLPTGGANVVADYRFGSGASAPGTGELTVIGDPQPNLKALRNPVAVGGGADPDPPEQLKGYAPRTVLTFGRAISAYDYEAMAAEAPGVARAQAEWAWSAAEQRSLVSVWVGDDANAVSSAQNALSLAGDPNRPVLVRQATPVDVYLFVALKISSDRQPDPTIVAVEEELADPDRGLFGSAVVRIGKPVYVSEVHEACLRVPGVIAVSCICTFASESGATTYQTGFRYEPGEGRFFRMPSENLYVFEGA